MSVIEFKRTHPVIIRNAVDILTRAQLDLSDEKRTQRDIALVFDQAGIEYTREVRLNKKDIIDFMLGPVGIEVKLKGGASKMDIYRQLARYAESEKVEALVLATNLSMGLPAMIGGKPAYFVSLGRAWL